MYRQLQVGLTTSQAVAELADCTALEIFRGWVWLVVSVGGGKLESRHVPNALIQTLGRDVSLSFSHNAQRHRHTTLRCK